MKVLILLFAFAWALVASEGYGGNHDGNLRGEYRQLLRRASSSLAASAEVSVREAHKSVSSTSTKVKSRNSKTTELSASTTQPTTGNETASMMGSPRMSTTSTKLSKSTTAGFKNSTSAMKKSISMKNSTSLIASSSAISGMNSTIRIPTPTYTHILGPVSQSPASQWINDPHRQVYETQRLLNAKQASTSTYDTDVWYDERLNKLFAGTGMIPINASTEQFLTNRVTTPVYYSRDGGHGGMIGDYSIWIFADTATWSNVTATHNGSFIGFVANSAAVDLGKNARQGLPIVLQDTPGSFSGPRGTARWWIPMTEGELMYNMQDPTGRYAHWPTSSLVPYNNASSLLYCNIWFINSKSNITEFQYAGNTLVNVTIQAGQPMADRLVNRLFPADIAPFGNTFGGYRSWGVSGVGGHDGKIYVLAPSNHGGAGLFLARVSASQATNLSAYEYWHNYTSTGPIWDSIPHAPNSSVSDMMLYVGPNTFEAGDLIFSPYHGTFILIYQDNWADNALWWTYLKVPQRLNPHYKHSMLYNDIASNLVKYPWAKPQLIMHLNHYKDYTYDVGAHVGYFGAEDISNGGTRMLVSWTAPANWSGGQLLSTRGYGGYQIWTAEIDWA